MFPPGSPMPNGGGPMPGAMPNMMPARNPGMPNPGMAPAPGGPGPGPNLPMTPPQASPMTTNGGTPPGVPTPGAPPALGQPGGQHLIPGLQQLMQSPHFSQLPPQVQQHLQLVLQHLQGGPAQRPIPGIVGRPAPTTAPGMNTILPSQAGWDGGALIGQGG